MTVHSLKKLAELGQSVWYDFIRRDLIQTGKLERLIRQDGLAGMTSNPTIFQKAVGETDLYDEDIRRLGAQGKDAAEIFEGLAVRDVQSAADVFRPVYEETGGNDGFVSIEVAPKLARDTEGTIEEARRLWAACARPNVMVKIPGTKEGLRAIRASLVAGININITLLFSVQRHREVMEAYLSAMEERVSKGLPVDHLRSVASFFVSRVDTNADKKIDAKAKTGSEKEGALARRLRGKLGVANARIAYEAFEEVFGGDRFGALQKKGVRLQRPLWASTSTKDPSLPDLYYVEALIAPNTVDTMPPETFDAYRDHGDPKIRIREDLAGAHAVFTGLEELGIEGDAIFRELEDEGIQKFSDSFDALLKMVAEKEKAVRSA
ncbi:MAG TPA: transaldolase [Vicinamibacteria bacterium]|jgi:transaldolase|nr:transaldolase [Vicinamibacteria bacterium]